MSAPFSPLINQLISALCCLPGVGPKSAQRMAFYLLEKQPEQAQRLAECIGQAVKRVTHCQQCNLLCEKTLCAICNNTKRDTALLCIVESPADVIAIEQTSTYAGHYFVLQGCLSPIDGIGPNEIGIPKLYQLLEKKPFTEIILATNATVEGEATAYYISQHLKQQGITISRIAHGVPMGGALEYVDSHTLRFAFTDRKTME